MQDVQRFERREQILTRKNAIEVRPTKGVERLECRIVIHDGDGIQAKKWREVFEAFHPKLSICLDELWSDRQRF